MRVRRSLILAAEPVKKPPKIPWNGGPAGEIRILVPGIPGRGRWIAFGEIIGTEVQAMGREES